MKRKLTYLIILLLAFLMVIKIEANDNIFNFTHNEINVPYKATIEEYINIVKDGITLIQGYDDPDFYIEYDGINYTFVHVINTNILRTYYLYFKVTSPKYNKTITKKISFHVVDVVGPTVTSSKDITVVVNSNKPNYISYITYQDDTCSIIDINVLVDDSKVDLTRVGIYEITYYLTDLYGNQTTHHTNVLVIDNIKPVITKIKEAYYIVGSTFNIYHYFSVSDNYDSYVSLDYELKDSLNEPRQVLITLSAADSSGNQTTLNSYIDVVLNNPPYVINSSPFYLQIGDKNIDYLKYLIYEDDLTETKDIKVSINDSNVRYDELGEYEVIYELIDSHGSIYFYIEKVYIIDLIKPVIKRIDNSLYTIGTYFNIYDYFIVTDNYDKEIVLEYIIDGDLTVVGKVDVILSATDSSGNTAEYISYINVLGTLVELTLKQDYIDIEVFSKNINLLNYIEVNNNYDNLTLDDVHIDSFINFNIIGKYGVDYYLYDSNNNLILKTLEVYIKDTTPPVIEVFNITVLQYESVDLFKHVVVTDNYYSNSDIKLTIYDTNLNTNVVGSYYVIYEAVDGSGNFSYQTITVNVEKASTPTWIIILSVIGVLLIISGSVVGVIFYLKKRKKSFNY